MWPVEFESRVDAYIKEYIGRNLTVIALQTDLIRLFMTDNGLPSIGEIMSFYGGYYRWIIHHHTVILQQVARQVGRETILVTRVLLVIDSEVRGEDGIQLLMSMLK